LACSNACQQTCAWIIRTATQLAAHRIRNRRRSRCATFSCVRRGIFSIYLVPCQGFINRWRQLLRKGPKCGAMSRP